MARCRRCQAGRPGGEPVFAVVAEHELQQPGHLVPVLAGAEQIGDLGGFGELPGGQVPDPGWGPRRALSAVVTSEP
jgi:hypothetical protein